jgi:cytochrome c peroxidase
VVLIGAGVVLLGLASEPMLAGAQSAPASTPVCNKQGTITPCQFIPEDELGVPLGSLKTVAKPTDPQLAQGGRFVQSQSALVALGKALFWDQQVGSDGQSCASCHFSAGADPRSKNQVSPGLKANDNKFEIVTDAACTTLPYGCPNHQLVNTDFPIHKLSDPGTHGSIVIRDHNDVISSAGVFYRTFTGIQSNGSGLAAPRPAFDPSAMDTCASVDDPNKFQVQGVNVRRVEPRNTPTMINAMFNNRNFWDSRAQDVFNGVNPFGARDIGAFVFEDTGGASSTANPVQIRIAFSSLASQAVGPPLSEFEMSCFGRTFPDVGHKLLTSTNTPLAQQTVAASDSVLGPISNARFGLGSKGLIVKYGTLVRLAFPPRWWQSQQLVNGRPQIEANFSMFFGLAVGAYVETLRADDSVLDRFFDGTGALSADQRRGLLIFESAFGTAPDPNNPKKRVTVTLSSGQPADTRCTTCHGGPETTAASIDAVRNDARLERMSMLAGARPTTPACAIYDAGHFNTGVRPTSDDLSLGASDPFNHSFAETQVAIDHLLNPLRPALQTLVPTAVPPFGLAPALGGTTNCDSANVDGTFKAPQLRNVELTGPYFHNGGELTLRQVVDFYNRGADFDNTAEIDPNVHHPDANPTLNLFDQDKNDLVAFLKTLTDERVAFEKAPFDHPGLCVSNGADGSETSVTTGSALPGGGSTARAADIQLCIDAVGAAGRGTRLGTFLNADPSTP